MSVPFHQPIIDKSLVSWDIRGARPKFIEKENKLLERQNLSPLIPEKHPEDYVVPTRFGVNPHLQKIIKNHHHEVSMPQGESPFDFGGKKHYSTQKGEINQYKSLENPYNLPQNYEFSQPYYPRSLNVQDIDGANPGSLQSKAVINKDHAKKVLEQQKQEEDRFNNKERNAFDDYQDALDRFKNELNSDPYAKAPIEYQDRLHQQKPSFTGAPQQQAIPETENNSNNNNNPYSDYSNRRQEQLSEERQVQQSYANRMNNENIDNPYQPSRAQQQQQQTEQYRPTQDSDPRNQQYPSEQPQQLNPNQQRGYHHNTHQGVRFEDEERNNHFHMQEHQHHRNPQQHQQQQQQQYLSQSSVDPRQYDASNDGNYAQQLPRRDIASSMLVKPHDNLLKRNQQAEIISHTMNNISPQITKQQLGPSIDHSANHLPSPAANQQNPPSDNNKQYVIRHRLIGNQIVSKEKPNQPFDKDWNYTNLNLQQFHKYAGEMQRPNQPYFGKTSATNHNIFSKEMPIIPKSTMESVLKDKTTFYNPGERNLQQYQNPNTSSIPTFKPYNQNQYSSQPTLQPYQPQQQQQQPIVVESKLARNPLPFGAPFSYNPNEFKKKEMVSLNHQKQLEKIETIVENTSKTVERYQLPVQYPQQYPQSQQYPQQQQQQQQQPYQQQNYHQEMSLIGRQDPHQYPAGLSKYGPSDRSQSTQNPYQKQVRGLSNLSDVRIF